MAYELCAQLASLLNMKQKWKNFWAAVDRLLEEIVYGDRNTIVLDYVAIKKVTPTTPMENVPTPQQAANNIPPVPTATNPDILVMDWSKPTNAYHNARVLCDLAGLTVDEKNLICACIYQESRFNNAAVCRNRNAQGIITSSDWGLCQINDYFNIGSDRVFPTVDSVVDNPQAAVQFMINEYKNGNLKLWVSFTSGAYKQWLGENSPMWKLTLAL